MASQSSPDKRERQYEHIKESYEKRGQKGRAEEIAARTVNKTRAAKGETQDAQQEQERQASSSDQREGRSRQALYEEAQRRGIRGRSSMNKEQLENALK